ncbi:MAG: glutamate racemase [Ruminococcaceae bacterium]|nr:glutamate racemase [Oscillospiraceae bacterium]
MDMRPIGVFDSGLGGLTAVRCIEELLPNENIIYFGDTGRVPYGTRGEDVIRKYTDEDCNFLESFDVKLIIAACGTVSSVAGDILHSRSVCAVDVVEPTARAAVSATRNKRIGIIGTAATVRSGSYAKVIEALMPEASVYAKECPMLVPLVENGWINEDDSIARLCVERYLETLKTMSIDTLILGCTHFPLLIPHIRAYLGEDVSLISAGGEAAMAAAEILKKSDSLTGASSLGNTAFYVSDKSQNFKNVCRIFLGRDPGDINVVDINRFTK